MEKEFVNFKKSGLGLEIWSGKKVIFSSKKSGIQGLLEFIGKHEKSAGDLIIFDTKVGNAVALLCVFLKVNEIYGVLGSQMAAKTLKENNIKFHFSKTIPNILNKNETDICPMEKLSFFETPESFVKLSQIRFAGN